MKKVLFTMCIFFVLHSKSQTSVQITNLTNYIKIWGFLKYYHPNVANGSMDWDSVFMKKVPEVLAIKNQIQASNYLSDWIRSLGDIPVCKSCKPISKDAIAYNLNLPSYDSSNTLSDELKESLKLIEVNRYLGKHYFVSSKSAGNTAYTNEKPYEDSLYPSMNMRLLSLARYWNIINYFFPYKYVTDQNWNDVLPEMIPKFLNAKDSTVYQLTCLELIAKTDDGHAGNYTIINKYFGGWFAPISYKMIDHKAVITGFYDREKAQKNDLQIGDVILKVDNKPVMKLIDQNMKYISASNYATKLKNAQGFALNGTTDSIAVILERNGNIVNKIVKRYPWNSFKRDDSNNKPLMTKIDKNIGYINLGVLTIKNSDSVLEQLKDSKAIIFDVRNYPKGTMSKISNFLNPNSVAFAWFTAPKLSYPGIFETTPPYKVGTKNKNYYKGKVYVLFNETTQSHAEFTVMALQTAPNVTTIGSQTAGADGNVSEIILPGEIKTFMTGIGVFYPDGRPTQRIGMVPDIEVHPTIKGIREGRDEVLERAIQEANKL